MHYIFVTKKDKMPKIEEKEDEIDSGDEALLEMLGLPASMDVKAVAENLIVRADDDDDDDSVYHHATTESNEKVLRQLDQRDIPSIIDSSDLRKDYRTWSVCRFPSPLSIPATLMRRLTDELVWGGDNIQADKTYETISVLKNGELRERRTLTRLENFVDHHPGWSHLCHTYLRRCISELMGEEMVLFKEKLNLKPPGGSGFAPHLDGPSLRVAIAPSSVDSDTEKNNLAPKSFVTVMVAIDDMNSQNGCLRIVKGPWSEHNTCEVIVPEEGANPDAGGRAGAIPAEVADSLTFEDMPCSGGSIVAFGEWTPHRSTSNTSLFSRRAVFLTYNPLSDGNFHKRYYEKMNAMREEWRTKIGLTNKQDYENDLNALATVPK